MNKNDEFLINLLSAAIRNQQPIINDIEEVNLETVFNQAKSHQINSIIYPIIKNIEVYFPNDNKVISEWKRISILSGIKQIQFIKQINKVLLSLEKVNVSVIALKGLVLRKMYMNPEFRTMTDADLLIKKEDLEEAKKVLLDMGYIEEHVDSKHMLFVHKNSLPIEIHWSLFDEIYVKSSNILTEKIWSDLIQTEVCDQEVLTLSFENNILYLCEHMASHIVYSGFGLRQLCDFVLLVESNKDKINWDKLHKDLKYYNIEKFAIAIFEVCRRIFGLIVPKPFQNKDLTKNTYIDRLLIYILVGGAFGKRNIEAGFDNILLKEVVFDEKKGLFRKIKYILFYLFPIRRNLDEKYNYVHKSVFLIPIAWIHRFIFTIFTKKLSINAKSSTFFSSISILEKRTELIKWLELK